MAGLAVGIVGAGGVGVATASALIMRGLAGRVTVYSRDGGAAHGLALDFMHARPLLSQIEVRGRGLDEIEREDILVITAGHHTDAGREPARRAAAEHRGDGRRSRPRSRRASCPRIALVVTNPLDVMTEYLTRRWSDRPVAVMGSGTALETLRLTDAHRARVRRAPAQRARVGGRRARRLVRVPARLRGRRHAAARRVRAPSAASTSPPNGSPRSSATCATRPTRSAT